MPRLALPVACLALIPFALAGCAPVDEKSSGDSADASCKVSDLDTVSKGKLTVGTDSPAYEPWFVANDPSNGKGFESAVAYAVAETMGFTANQVTWTKVPFNNSYAPGEKTFDFDINQISITPAREKAVDFSEGYYSAAQAVVTLEDGPEISSQDDLKDLKLAAQTGSTSLTAVRDVIEPSAQPLVLQSTSAAKQALLNGQADALVADLPTAFYITSVEIENSTIAGQFQPGPAAGEGQEEFGLLMAKGSGLRPCVNKAVEKLREDGTLERLEKKWLSTSVDVPSLD